MTNIIPFEGRPFEDRTLAANTESDSGLNDALPDEVESADAFGLNLEGLIAAARPALGRATDLNDQAAEATPGTDLERITARIEAQIKAEVEASKNEIIRSFRRALFWFSLVNAAIAVTAVILVGTL